MRTFALALVLALLPAAAGAQEVERFPLPGGLDLPFSEAVRAGPFLILSGMIGNPPGELRVVEGGIEAETRQTLENIRAVLERHGSSLDRVLRCTVMLADIDEWAAMNGVYREFFPAGPPARTSLGGVDLVFGARVEIECWAAAGG